MNKPNMSYGIRNVSNAEIVEAFGSLGECLRVTGGDLPTILFYMHNRDRIESARRCDVQATDEFGVQFREDALAEAAGIAWDRLADEEKRQTVTAVAKGIGVCRATARRLLERSGRREAVCSAQT